MKTSVIVTWLVTFNLSCTFLLAQSVFDGPYGDGYIKGFACVSSAFGTFEAALEECLACATCGGIVQKNGVYETRKESVLRPSDSGETAWLVDPMPSTSTFGLELPGKWLPGYACGERYPFYDIANAKRACGECGECGGVTCNAGGSCTIRKGTTDQTSYSGESSYLIDDPSIDACPSIHADMVPSGFSGGQAPDGYGSMDITIAGDLESFTARVEYNNLTSEVKGMHIHLPGLLAKIVFLCVDDMSSGCEQTYHRGDVSITPQRTWDELLGMMLNNDGLFGIIHTIDFPEGELTGTFFCGGIPVQPPVPECIFGFQCPLEIIMCTRDPNCLAWTVLYSLDICHLDEGRDRAKFTPVDTCWTMLSLDLSSPSKQLAQNFFDCMICCGPCP